MRFAGSLGEKKDELQKVSGILKQTLRRRGGQSTVGTGSARR